MAKIELNILNLKNQNFENVSFSGIPVNNDQGPYENPESSTLWETTTLWGPRILERRPRTQNSMETQNLGPCSKDPGLRILQGPRPRTLKGSMIYDPLLRIQDLVPRILWGLRTLLRRPRIQDPLRNKEQEHYWEDPEPYEDIIEKMQDLKIWEYPADRIQDQEFGNLWDPCSTLLRTARILWGPRTWGALRRIHFLWRASIQYLIKVVKLWYCSILCRIVYLPS